MSVDYSIPPDGILDAAVSTVVDRIERMDSVATRYQKELSSSLASLSNIEVTQIDAPTRLIPPELVTPSLNLGAIPQFSLTTPSSPDLPELQNIDNLLSNLSLIDFDIPDPPEMPDVHLPDAPALNHIQTPIRPDINTEIDIPEAPVLVIPEMEELVQIKIPEFQFEALPDFNGNPPTIRDITVPNVFVNWAEPQYKSVVLDEIQKQVLNGLQYGGTGLPATVEEAMFNRARSRESHETNRAVQEVVNDWATRNYSMPQGMMSKQISAIRENGQLKASELNRDILIEAARLEIDNLKFLFQQGIALEQISTNLFSNMLNRLFEVARFNAESQINVFNAQISLFNAQNQSFETLCNLYKIKVEGVLSKITAYKTSIDAQVAIGQVNDQKIQIFKAKHEALQNNVELYKALMAGASTRSDIIKSKFEAYRAEVQAYSEEINAEKLKVDTYQAKINGETYKVNMYESQSRAFTSKVQAIQSKGDLKAKEIQLRMEAARTWIQKYTADVDGYKATLQANVNEAQIKTSAFNAQVEGWRAGAGIEIAQAEMQSRFYESNARTNISYAEMQIKEYDAKIQKSIQEAQLALEAAKSLGQYTAQLASGALSAAHVSASISGSGSSSNSFSSSSSESTSHNYNY